jgi:hypothetical protein
MNTNTSFEQYYQNIRMRQKRDTVAWSLVLLILYFAAGNAAEFNLNTIWHSLPNFFDYMLETVPTLHVSTLFADSHTVGHWLTGAIVCLYSCRLSGKPCNWRWQPRWYRLSWQRYSPFWRQETPGRRRWCVLVSARWWPFYGLCQNWRGRLSL